MDFIQDFKFKFVTRLDDGNVYHAQKTHDFNGNLIYIVSWTHDGIHSSTLYTIDDVENKLRYGDWIKI